MMRIVGTAKGHETIEAIADTGAGLELAPEDRLSVEILKDTLQPGRARLMNSASANQIRSKGGAALQFRLGTLDHVFKQEFQVTAGDATPTILGNKFWALHKAKFDFEAPVI